MSKYGTGYGWGWWKKTTASDLQQEMTGTTSVFGRNKSIKVEFKGREARSEKGKVIFPAIDPNTEFEDSTVKLMRGWVDSEAALQRFSDTDFVERVKENHAQEQGFLEFFKAVESSRVETDYTEFYSGAGKNLNQLSEEAFAFGKKNFTDKRQFVPTAINMMARGRMDGVYNFFSRKEMGEYVDTEQVEEWVDRIENLETSQEAYELAKEIYEVVTQQQPQPMPQKQKSGGGGEGEKPEEPKEEGEGNSSGSGKSKGDEEQDDKQKSKSQSLPNGFGGGGGTERFVNDKIDEAVKKMQDKRKKGDGGPYDVYTTEYDTFVHWKDDKTWRECVDVYTKAKDSMGAELATAKRKLELMIQSTQKISWETMKERGRLDSKRLVGAFQGEQNVFKIKRDDSDLDTAVAVCVDLSGSMNGGKAYQAFMSAIVLSELLSKIGVPFEITGFDSTDETIPYGVKSGMYDDGGRKYGRCDALRIHEFKRFGDRFFDARQYMYRMATLDGAAHGNCDGESIMIAANRLMKRPEKRKIMFVLSDGHPACYGDYVKQYQHLKDVTKLIEKQGVDLVGIGICDSAVKEFYSKYIVLNSANNLPATILGLLKDKLLPSDKKKVA